MNIKALFERAAEISDDNWISFFSEATNRCFDEDVSGIEVTRESIENRVRIKGVTHIHESKIRVYMNIWLDGSVSYYCLDDCGTVENVFDVNVPDLISMMETALNP